MDAASKILTELFICLELIWLVLYALLMMAVLGQSGVTPPGQGGQGQVQNRVIGGSVSSPNAWPWQVNTMICDR